MTSARFLMPSSIGAPGGKRGSSPDDFAKRFIRSARCQLVLLEFHLSKAESITDDREAGKSHCCASYHGAEEDAGERIENARSNRHAEAVIGEGKEEVLADVAHHHAAHRDRPRDACEIALDQNDRCAPRWLTSVPGAHGHADVGLRERGSIIDTIASHGYDRPMFFELPDDCNLVFWGKPGPDLIDTEGPAQPLRWFSGYRRSL